MIEWFRNLNWVEMFLFIISFWSVVLFCISVFRFVIDPSDVIEGD